MGVGASRRGSGNLLPWLMVVGVGGCADPAGDAPRASEQGLSLGAEVMVDPRIRLHVSPEQYTPASVGWNGSTYLLAWTDTRSGTYQIYAARFDATGAPLEPAGFAVAPAIMGQVPSVASDGRDFLIAWAGGAARVSAAGAVLGRVTLGTCCGTPGVAYDGAGYAVAWTDGGTTVYVSRLDASGATRDASPIAIRTTSPASDARIAASSSGYLVAWDTSTDVRVARLARDGTVLDPGGRAVTAAAAQRGRPEVASDGTNYLVAWNAQAASGSRDAGNYGVLLSPSATPVGPAVTYFGPAYVGHRPGVSFDGTNFVVAWLSNVATVQAARVDRAGALLDPTPRAVGTFTESRSYPGPAVARSMVVVYGQYFNLRSDATGTGPVRDGTMIGDVQIDPHASFDGTNFLVSWAAQLGPFPQRPNLEINAARISPAGAVLDRPALTAIARGGDASFQIGMAFNGIDHVITSASPPASFGEMYGTLVARVSPAGVSGGAPTAANDMQKARALAAGGGVTLLGSLTLTRARRVGAGGVLLDRAPIDLGFTAPAADFDGTNFFVTGPGATTPCSLARALRVSPAGDVVDFEPFVVPCATDVPNGIHRAVAFDGTNHLVVWDSDPVGFPTLGTIYATRMSATGAVLDARPFRLPSGASGQHNPTAVYDGRSFVVAWEDFSRGAGDIVATRVSGAGAVLDPAGIALGAGPTRERSPQLAAGRNGATLATWSRYDEVSGVDRVMARVVYFNDDAGVIDAGVIDAGADAAVDARPDVADATVDARMDVASTDAPDARADVTVMDVPITMDVAADARADAATDVIADARADAATDASVDVAAADGAMDVTGDDASTDAAVDDASDDVALADAARDLGADTATPPDASTDASSTDDVATDDAAPDAATPAPAPDGGGLCSTRPGRSTPAGAWWSLLVVAAGLTRRRSSREWSARR